MVIGRGARVVFRLESGQSVVTNDEAVRAAQNAIDEALRNRCVPISIGGGTGAGVGLGLCTNPQLPKHSGDVPPCIERQEVGATYNVHVLVECPLDAPDLLPTGIAAP